MALIESNRPFVARDHMIQNTPNWSAKNVPGFTGRCKTKKNHTLLVNCLLSWGLAHSFVLQFGVFCRRVISSCKGPIEFSSISLRTEKFLPSRLFRDFAFVIFFKTEDFKTFQLFVQINYFVILSLF